MSDAAAGDIEERAPGSRIKYWLLLDADRLALTGALLLVIFASTVLFGALDPTPLPAVLVSTSTVQYAFQALLTAIVTGVTLVVTINQLVLSQELGAVGDQRRRMTGSREFRESVETVVEDAVSPADPAAFVSALLGAIRNMAGELRETATDDETVTVAEQLVADTDHVREEVTDAEFDTFGLVGAMLDFDYSSRLYQVRRLRTDLEREADATAGRIVHALELFGIAREHFKTLYFQWELVNLSRRMLYASVPALIVVTGTVLYVDLPGTITGSTLGVSHLVWYVSAAATLALAPFCLLLVYVLRIATVARRTLAIGPFVLQSRDQSDR